MRTMATGHSGPFEHVWEVDGVLARACARGESEGRTESTGRHRVLACPWRVLARSIVSGRHGARRVLGAAVILLANGEYRQVCGSEARLLDMVGEAREEWREG
jgi:hypothetical protein